jgi:hypothetical protein
MVWNAGAFIHRSRDIFCQVQQAAVHNSKLGTDVWSGDQGLPCLIGTMCGTNAEKYHVSGNNGLNSDSTKDVHRSTVEEVTKPPRL